MKYPRDLLYFFSSFSFSVTTKNTFCPYTFFVRDEVQLCIWSAFRGSYPFFFPVY